MKFEPVFLHSQILYLLQYEIKKREQPLHVTLLSQAKIHDK